MSEITSSHRLAHIKKHTIVGAISYFGRTLFIQLIGLISMLVLSAHLSPEDFGIYGVVLMIIGILVFFSDIGLAAALIQKPDEPTSEDYRTAFTVQQILSWLIFAITVVLAGSGLIEAKTGQAGSWILLALGISFPLATFKTVPSIILERKLDFSKLVIPQIVEQVVFHTVLIVLAIQGWGVIMYAYAVIVRSVAGVLTMYLIQPWHIGVSLHGHSLRTLLGFGVQFQLNDFLARIKDQLYHLVLAAVLPLHQFGYIQWAKNWSMYPYTLTVQNVMAITFPSFSRLQNDSAALVRGIEKTIFFIALVIIPLLTGMSIFIIPLLELFPVYEKWLPAAVLLILFNVGVVWSAISTPLTNAFNAIGKISISLRLMIFWTVLTWILTPPAIHFFGYQGVGVAALFVSSTSFITILIIKRLYCISILDQVWRQLVGSVAMISVGLIGWEYWSTSIVAMFAGFASTSIAYLLMLVLLGREKLVGELGSVLSVLLEKKTSR
jgi:O-antigen/teichoic acid export membrane protein